MLPELVRPNCHKRRCKHFLGVFNPTDDDELYIEAAEYVYCRAFPNGIPSKIAYGNNKHLEPLEGQENDIVFEGR